MHELSISYEMTEEVLRTLVTYKIATRYTKENRVFLAPKEASFLEYMLEVAR